MASDKQTIIEPKGATRHGKRSTKSAVVSKVFGEDREGSEERGQTRGGADKRLLASAGKDGV
jgi:hypothetical protein